jgi:hypothetical protein
VKPFHTVLLSSYAIAVLLIFSGSTPAATVIDFDDIKDGTPVSAGNPYAGVVDLQATGQAMTADGTILPAEGTISTQFDPSHGGVAQALPPPIPDAIEFSSDMAGTFLQPVTDGSLQVFVFRNSSYSYTGSDNIGDIFNGAGTITGNIESGGVLTWQQLAFSLPAGYALTSFDIANRDLAAPLDGAVWIDNVTFTVVPEPLTCWMLLMGIPAILLLHRGKEEAGG